MSGVRGTGTSSNDDKEQPAWAGLPWWARRVSNLRPLAC